MSKLVNNRTTLAADGLVIPETDISNLNPLESETSASASYDFPNTTAAAVLVGAPVDFMPLITKPDSKT
jgi:hypothetical protein